MNTMHDPDWLDSRVVFRTYATVVGVTGVLVAAWGTLLLQNSLGALWYAQAPFVRIIGVLMLALGIAVWCLSDIDNPVLRRRALRRLAVVHTIVAAMVVIQFLSIWDDARGAAIAGVAVSFPLLLFYFWTWAEGHRPGENAGATTLFADGLAATDQLLRSRYEQQIREAAGQEERHRLARDLHDSVKQQIFVIQTAAATAQVRFEEDQAGARDALEQVRVAAREAMSEMQAMLDQLRAEPLENTGLVSALQQQCEALRIRTGAQVDFRTGWLPPSEQFQPGEQRAIFRIAQEALSNVARHAAASHVRVSLMGDSEGVHLVVEDDGRGFDPEGQPHGMGLDNMRSRAQAYGGTLSVSRGTERGTRVTLRMPIARDRGLSFSDRRRLVGLWTGQVLFSAVFVLMGLRLGDHYGLTMVPVGLVSAVILVYEVIAYRRQLSLERRTS